MNNNIFISIASYRDKNCTKTIESIYENAKYPENIFSITGGRHVGQYEEKQVKVYLWLPE